jgi:hypothetical protein
MLPSSTHQQVERFAYQSPHGGVPLDRHHAEQPAHILAEITDDGLLALARLDRGSGGLAGFGC